MKKHFTASAIIFRHNTVLLLLHKKLGVWLYPGGHIEDNENPAEALYREVREETGLDITILGERDALLETDQAQVLHTPYCVLCEYIEDGHYHNDLVYLCVTQDSDADILVGPEESLEIGFFTEEDALSLPMFPNLRALLAKAFRDMRA